MKARFGKISKAFALSVQGSVLLLFLFLIGTSASAQSTATLQGGRPGFHECASSERNRVDTQREYGRGSDNKDGPKRGICDAGLASRVISNFERHTEEASGAARKGVWLWVP